MRQRDSLKNFVFGILGFVITTLLGIIIPRLFLLSYGSEVNGLINSVKQIFSYFTLLEAGVGGATLQALYGPVAKNEYNEVSSILSATKNFYKKTGIIYAISVIVFAVAYPIIVSSEIPKYIIVFIILFQGEAGVVKYLVTARLQLLLKVDGKTYIITNLSTIFTIISNIARISLMYMGFGVFWVQGIFCIIDILQVIYIVVYMRRHYGWLDDNAKPNYAALGQRNSVLVHQLSGLVFNNTDTIILTFFCGLKVVSVYAMYSLLFGMIASIISTFSSSVNFAMGQLFNSDKKQYTKIQECYETYYLALSFSLFTIGFIFILPFLKLYTSGVNDINYIDIKIAGLFLAVQLLNYGRNTSNNIIDYAGHFKETRWRSILETTINLSVSLICVYKFGIYGVLIGTVTALAYRTNDIILYANHKIMFRSVWPTYRRWGRNVILAVLISWCGMKLPQQYSGYMILIGTAIVVSIAVVGIFIGVNTLLEKEARETGWSYINSLLKNMKEKFKGKQCKNH